MKKHILAAALCAALLTGLCVPMTVRAEETQALSPGDAIGKPEISDENSQEAQAISVEDAITQAEGFPSRGYLYDGELTKAGTSQENASLTLEDDRGIGSLYLIYRTPYGSYTLVNNDTGQTYTAGTQDFIHEFLDLRAIFGQAPTSVTLQYDGGKARLCEVQAYTPGRVPDSVQQWEAPGEDRTDLLLFSTHGDDEQLFFAGILPYYAGALDYQVQVVYLTDHRNNTAVRVHEMLDGLWAVGVRTYPVFGSFPDFLIEDLEDTYAEFRARGVTRDDIIEFCVEQLRRFKPKVIVAHDFDGEYSHGQHMVYADCVAAALELAPDPEQYPDLAQVYGTWDTPKAYFHLYEENPIVMDWDTPMEALGGLSPFQVTQQYGFPCHESQQWTWFRGWLNGKGDNKITRADQIKTHSPCQFGLYRTTVGPDVEKNDFFENVTTYAQDEAAKPPETTPPETTPQQTTPPEPATPPQTDPAPTQTAPEDNGDGKLGEQEQAMLMLLLGLLCLLVALLFFLLSLRKRR